MCGIVGAVGNRASRGNIDSELIHLARRGPDHQELIQVRSNILFGSTRLAMVDPHPRSNQPFTDPDTGDVISFNGEIYNYLEIKESLLELGVNFRTESDTEVLLKFLQKYGIDKISELNGMYAFAYFDAGKSTLTLARDELGKKPLYYFKDASNFIWSSSIESVAHLAGLPKLIPEKNLNYLINGYYLDPNTPYEEINQILPSQTLTVCTHELKVLSNVTLKKCSLRRREDKTLRDSLKYAVETRCNGHDSIAISLSGGVDSAVIAILAAELNLKCETYSAHWSDSDKSRYNTDSLLAAKISKNLGFKHNQVEMIQAKNLVNEIDSFLDAMEEPNSNPSGVSMMRLYKSIGDHGHRLVLTGDGADEILSGYDRYERVLKIPNLLKIHSPAFQNLALADRKKRNGRLLGILATQLSPNTVASWLYWHAIFTPSELAKLSPELLQPRKIYSDFSTNFENLTTDNIDMNASSLLMSKDFQVWLPMESNRRLDRISMYHSIEARSPFQDRDVVDVARRLMRESKYKILEKRILRDSFPELRDLGVREDKAGFISPLGHWLRTNPKLVSETLNYLESQLKWNPLELSKYRDAPQRGIFRELVQLWNLVVFVRWSQR
jgi:asparagine synthase (glutamine-hydrolysing)